MAGRSLSAWIDLVAGRQPGRPAIVEGETHLTFSDLARESRRVAAGLRALGLRREDSLALWLPNFHEWLVLNFAAARLGLRVVALNPRYRAAELAALLTASGAKALALTPSFRGVDYLAMARDVAPHVHQITVRGAAGDAVGYAQLREHGEAGDEGTGSDLLSVFPTSGTTASPKLAAHHQAGPDRT